MYLKFKTVNFQGNTNKKPQKKKKKVTSLQI